MNAKELRLGNYIHPLLDKKEVAEICYIGENDFGYERLSDKEYFQGNSIKPIPLTEEWLVKFGAELKKVVGMDNEYNLKLGEVEVSWDKKTGVTVFVLDTLESFRVSYIKYVHQFQNFCFALTNEELTTKQ
mgnify:CR=1 FL=1